jgi:hypothetical protein
VLLGISDTKSYQLGGSSRAGAREDTYALPGTIPLGIPTNTLRGHGEHIADVKDHHADELSSRSVEAEAVLRAAARVTAFVIHVRCECVGRQ